jgi:hypothetical protein
MAPEILRGDVALRTGRDGLIISLREAGFFASGSAGVKESSQPAFSRIAKLLGEGHYNIRIEGHTDNVRIHNTQYSSNWELSTARSTEMIRLLVVKYGLDPQRLSASGYGEYHPIASNSTETGRALNRRVDLVVVGKQDLRRLCTAGREDGFAPGSDDLHGRPDLNDAFISHVPRNSVRAHPTKAENFIDDQTCTGS